MADKNLNIPYGFPGNPGFMQDSPFVPQPAWNQYPDFPMQGQNGMLPMDEFGNPLMMWGAPNLQGADMMAADAPFPDSPFSDNAYPEMEPSLYPTSPAGVPPIPNPLLSQMPGSPQFSNMPMPGNAISQSAPAFPAQGAIPDQAQNALPDPMLKAPSSQGSLANQIEPVVAANQHGIGQPFAASQVQQHVPNGLDPNETTPLPSRIDALAPKVATSPSNASNNGNDATTLPLVQAKFDPNVGRMRDPEAEEEGKRRGATLAIILLSIAVVALAAALFYVTDPFGLFRSSAVDPPSETQVESAFNEAYIPLPDLLPYSYINDNGLERVSLSDFEPGIVNYETNNNVSDAYSQCSAIATYKNDSVAVEQELALKLVFDRNERDWNASSATTISLEVIPIAAANLDMILADFNKIAASFNPSLASMYENATVESIPESRLTSDGGILTLSASKTASDGTPLNCVLKCVVAWSNESGWIVSVDSVEGNLPIDMLETVGDNDADAVTPVDTTTETVSTADAPTNSEALEEQQDGENNVADDASGLVQYRLTCSPGAKVKVPGTIELSSGKILLKTFGLMEVLMSGRTYKVDYFEILGDQSFVAGQGVDVCGTIGVSNSQTSAPLTITIG